MTCNGRTARRGLNLIEVVVVVAILGVVALFVLLRMPRSRELARGVSCQKNLMQIGVALNQYHADAGHLPQVWIDGPGPLRACLEQLAVPDFTSATDPKTRMPSQPGIVTKEGPVRGFICPSDTNATSGRFPAPISYRASTGSTPDGLGGSFPLDRQMKLAAIDSADGLSFTAAFSERLLGADGPASSLGLAPLETVADALSGPDCPSGNGGSPIADAGATWWRANWPNTLYNHALTPNAARSCVSADGKTGLVGASSAHTGGVNVLLMDGTVRTYSPRVDPRIWRALGTVEDPAPAPSPSVPTIPAPTGPR